jgi:hypothetical protein
MPVENKLGSAPPTPLQLLQREAARGSQAWSGPTGAADAFALMGQHWNQGIYNAIASLATSTTLIGKL